MFSTARACISSLGNLAGFYGPYLVGIISDLTHRTAPGLYAIAVGLFIGITLILLTPANAGHIVRTSQGT